jgi:hypothetical protein
MGNSSGNDTPGAADDLSINDLMDACTDNNSLHIANMSHFLGDPPPVGGLTPATGQTEGDRAFDDIPDDWVVVDFEGGPTLEQQFDNEFWDMPANLPPGWVDPWADDGTGGANSGGGGSADGQENAEEDPPSEDTDEEEEEEEEADVEKEGDPNPMDLGLGAGVRVPGFLQRYMNIGHGNAFDDPEGSYGGGSLPPGMRNPRSPVSFDPEAGGASSGGGGGGQPPGVRDPRGPGILPNPEGGGPQGPAFGVLGGFGESQFSAVSSPELRAWLSLLGAA